MVSVEGFGVSRSGAATGADLGGSSKHSIKALQLLTDAEKGSTTTAIGRGLVGPKPRDNLPSNRLLSRSAHQTVGSPTVIRALKEKKTFGRKGIRLIFRNPARYRYAIPPLTTTKSSSSISNNKEVDVISPPKGIYVRIPTCCCCCCCFDQSCESRREKVYMAMIERPIGFE